MNRVFDVVVRGDLAGEGRLVRDGKVGVIDGRIAAIGEAAADFPAEQMLDYSGRLVLPGLVDSHVHTLSYPGEGIARATAAAAAGGITTIVDMPYDNPHPVMDAQRFREKVGDLEREAIVDVALYGTMAKVDGVEALPGLVDAGAAAFKFATFETDPVRFPRIAEGDLLAAFTYLAPTGIPIVIHAEAQEIIEPRLRAAIGRGEEDPDAHQRTRPLVSETDAIVRVAELALQTGARVHVAHVTDPHGFEIIAWYRSLGAHLSGETCVHYLGLSSDDVRVLGPIAKVNPPIRDRRAREGLWGDLLAGRVETVSTDHAPWPLEAKERPMLLAASGIPGLETMLPVLATEARARALDLVDLLPRVTSRPADLFGLGGRKGRLAVGYDADLAIFDPDVRWTFDAGRSLGSAKWSPFSGRPLVGQVEATVLRGEVIFASGALQVGAARPGRWLPRGHSVEQTQAAGADVAGGSR